MSLPTVILPGFLESAEAYYNLEKSLQNLGFPTVTVPLQRRDWIATLGGRPVSPILKQLDCTVEQILKQKNVSQINLIGSLRRRLDIAYLFGKCTLWQAQPQFIDVESSSKSCHTYNFGYTSYQLGTLDSMEFGFCQ